MMLPNVTVPRVSILREAGDVLGQVQIGYQRIESFHKLVVDQLPYGQIDPKELVQGLIELDGPDQDTPPIDKVPLQWYFGGQAYEVRKAIRVQYTYQKYLDAGPVNASGSLFIGYAPTRTGAARLAAEAIDALERRSARGGTTAAGRTTAQLRDELDQLRQHSSRLKDALRARSGAADWDSVKKLPGTVTALAVYVNADDFDNFIYSHIPGLRAAAPPPAIDGSAGPVPPAAEPPSAPPAQSAQQPPAQQLAQVFVAVDAAAGSAAPIVQIYYDGPAADYNSHKAFPYTTDTLFNDQEKYNQVLWWYFGGRAYRITKAMLLDYDAGAGASGILLVGYQGPGPS